MADTIAPVTQQQRRVIEQLWLHYYNQTLRDRGMISQGDYARMKARINGRSSPSAAR